MNGNDKDADFALSGYFSYRFDEKPSCVEQSHKGIVVYSKVEFQTVKQSNVCGIESVFLTFETSLMKLHVVFMYCPPKEAIVGNMKNYFCKILELSDNSLPLIIMGDTNRELYKGTCKSTKKPSDRRFGYMS